MLLTLCHLAVIDVADASDLHRGAWFDKKAHGSVYGGAYAVAHFPWKPSEEFVRLANARASLNKDVYQLGVYTGGSMQGIATRIHGFGQMWGFDSFVGLPPEASGVHKEGRHWNQGAFSSSDAMRTYSTKALFRKLRHKINRAEGNVTFIRGYFNETMTPSLLREHRFQPALFVDVDGDLYISALDGVGWMLQNGLLVPGSLVRYDDWKDDKSWGETRAHEELTRRYHVKWRHISHVKHSYAEFELIECGACPRL